MLSAFNPKYEALTPSGEVIVVEPRWIWRKAWDLRWRGKGKPGDVMDAAIDSDPGIWAWFPGDMDFGDEFGLILLAIFVIPLVLFLVFSVFVFVLPLMLLLVEALIWGAASALCVKAVEVKNLRTGERNLKKIGYFHSARREAKRIKAEIEMGSLDPASLS